LKFLRRVPYSDGLPEDAKTNRSDFTLEKILRKEENEKLNSSESITPQITRPSRLRVGLLDTSTQPSLFDREIEVASVPPVSSLSLADRVISSPPSNTDALAAARSVMKISDSQPSSLPYIETASKLRFPKLPQWEPQQTNDPHKHSEFAHLMRPRNSTEKKVGKAKAKIISSEEEHARSKRAVAKALRKIS
jgi:hypothetical protein